MTVSAPRSQSCKAAARHVSAAVAVHDGQRSGWLFSITADDQCHGDWATRMSTWIWAAIAILIAIPFDSLDGRIARMTNTCSDFGKELDSLADAITFGVAPSLLALIWGFHFLPDSINPQLHENLLHAGAFICFLFLIGGVSRLARFNISHDPQPRNPGRPGRKYFVGMPIPAAAGLLAATVHFCVGFPVEAWWFAALLAGHGGRERLPDGQHLALLVGQGNQPHAPPSLPVVFLSLRLCCMSSCATLGGFCSPWRWCTCSPESGRGRRTHGRAAAVIAHCQRCPEPHPTVPVRLRRPAKRPMPRVTRFAMRGPALRHFRLKGSAVYKIAIAGASSLLGRELKDCLSESPFASAKFSLLDEEEAQGQLDQVGDEVTFIQTITAEAFEHADFTFFCGTERLTQKHWRQALRAGSTVLDLTGALDRRQAFLCAPPGWVPI